MFIGLDMLAARGTDIADWMDILVPLVLAVIYGINWLISKAVESAKKDRSTNEAPGDKEQPLPVRRHKTSPLNRAVPIKKPPTLSQELGRLAGHVMSQANLQNQKPAESPNQTPLPPRRAPVRPQQIPQPRPQPAPIPAVPQQPRPLVRSRPEPSPQPSPVQRAVSSKPRSAPVAAAVGQPPRQASPKSPAVAQSPKAEPASVPSAPQLLGFMFGDQEHLYDAIIFSEIFGRPVALRSEDPNLY
ncbi:MAG: hypothetical protein GX455_10495 [Phycisphaerae bacterium]|nr:hypothetical protein [Phycisphaerae bacterium]